MDLIFWRWAERSECVDVQSDVMTGASGAGHSIEHSQISCDNSNREHILYLLQLLGQQLVHLGNLVRHAEVDGPVANLHYQPAFDIRLNLCRISALRTERKLKL